ncbi:hypothetical protein BC936DRAFT_137747 [Jimgerdemannia flammicorona]|uniref:RGS domain-containing protein n=1 Tax=Jimgerdemannia flammicorona TaxID=994334 RepID=A0A433DN14_9FUNG|nr:hypothetical protein BC936DRAFT_137747 [Jimgerdemannia flammicorona]
MQQTTSDTNMSDAASELSRAISELVDNPTYYDSYTISSRTISSAPSIVSMDSSDPSLSGQVQFRDLSLNEILSHATLLRTFESCLSHAFCQENLLFIEALYQIIKEPNREKITFALKRIWKTFFTFGAPLELNVTDRTKRVLVKELSRCTKTMDQCISKEEVERMFRDVEREVLQLLRAPVVDFNLILRNTPKHISFKQPASSAQKRIVIVGGGFTGFTVGSILDPMSRFHVTLIDTKDSFEYTPGTIRRFVNPSEASSLRVPHEAYIKNGEIVIGYADSVDGQAGYVTVDSHKIEYDYLVIATGASYLSELKSTDISSTYRTAFVQAEYEELVKAEKILIIGGGLVGCELASEISQADFPATCPQKKEITILESGSTLVQRASPKQQEEVHAYMDRLGVKVVTDERILDFDWAELSFTSVKGTIYRGYDKIFMATGNKAQTNLLSGPEWEEVLDNNGLVKVTPTLQLRKAGVDNIFVGGDITNVSEEKTAYSATLAGVCIARNICRMEKGKKPLRQGMAGLPAPPAEPLQGLIGKTKLSPFKRTFAWLYPEWAALKQFNERQFLKLIQGESFMTSMAVGKLPRKLGLVEKRNYHHYHHRAPHQAQSYDGIHDLPFERNVTGIEGVLVSQLDWLDESSSPSKAPSFIL